MSARALLPLLGTLLLGACGSGLSEEERTGRALIGEYGCGACHEVPGVRGARGAVGPPLIHFRERVLVAGKVPNDRANLARFIMDPQQVEPGTAMPDLDVSAEEALAMASYLHTLR